VTTQEATTLRSASPARHRQRQAVSPIELRIPRDHVIGRTLLTAGVVAYAALLVASYAVVIAPAFSYLGYTFEPAAPPYVALGFSVSVLPAAWLPLRLVRPSASVLWIIYPLAYVPSTLVPLLSLARPAEDVVILVLAIAAAFALLSLVPNLPILRLQRPRIRCWLFWSAFVVTCGFFLIQVTSEHGFAIDLPSLSEVYDVREEYKDTAASRLSRLGVSWVGNVLSPFLIAVALVRRQPWLALPALALQAYLFSITGFRSLLFVAVILLVLLVASTTRGRFFGIYLAWGGSVLIATSWLLDQTFQTILFTSTFVRRLIATPGILTGWYYDFFSDNPQVRLSHSVLGRWIDYPYDVAPPFLIGARYFGRDQTYANANFWADAFANFGYTGIFAFTVIVGIVLWLADAVVGSSDPARRRLAVLLLGVPAFTLSNTALTTTLLTHGLGLALIVLFIMPQEVTAGAGDVSTGHPDRGHREDGAPASGASNPDSEATSS
jgi:hypothetical protein